MTSGGEAFVDKSQLQLSQKNEQQLTLGVTRHAKHDIGVPRARLGGSHENRVIRMGLDMLLQVLGTLEGLSTEVTLVRLQGNVDSDMRRDVVALDRRGTAAAPLAGQVEVVGALTANMSFTNVFLGAVSIADSRQHVNFYFSSFLVAEALIRRRPTSDRVPS